MCRTNPAPGDASSDSQNGQRLGSTVDSDNGMITYTNLGVEKCCYEHIFGE